jgi:quinol monooxygenase YgiN
VIFIVVKFSVRPEFAEQWTSIVNDFTQATRAETGNVFFDWSRSLEDRHEYILIEGFRDDEAGAARVQSAHFAAAMAMLPGVIAAKPKIINIAIPGGDWSEMAELIPR